MPFIEATDTQSSALTAYKTGTTRKDHDMQLEGRSDGVLLSSAVTSWYFVLFPCSRQADRPESASKSRRITSFGTYLNSAHPVQVHASELLLLLVFPWWWTTGVEDNRNTIQIVHEWNLAVACYKRGPNPPVDQTCSVLEQSPYKGFNTLLLADFLAVNLRETRASD